MEWDRIAVRPTSMVRREYRNETRVSWQDSCLTFGGEGVAEAPGRAGQRARTRTALIDAASELMRAGVVPTVPAAAEAANVSRATAYRYFQSQAELMEAVIRDAVAPFMDAEDLAEVSDPEALVDEMVRRVLPSFAEEGLADSIDRANRRRLAVALTALYSVDSYVVLTDVWGMDHDEAGEILRWAGRALLRGALAQASDA